MGRDISAVASFDMNGLKTLNDSLGHGEGDKALAEIGRCLQEVNDKNTFAYRVGGDEFVVLFLRQTKEAVEQVIRRIRENVEKAGYSVSIGYAMKTPAQNLEEALQESDRKMYQEKAGYYQKNGRDRRMNRSDG